MPRPSECEELRRELSSRGGGACVEVREELRAHLANCRECARLVETLAANRYRPETLYTSDLRRRTLAAARHAAAAPGPGLGWLLLPPAATGALGLTAVELWLVAATLQLLSVTPVLAWVTAVAVTIIGNLATAGLVALLVDRSPGATVRAAGSIRPLEV